MKKLILTSLIATVLTACGGSDSSEPVVPAPDYRWVSYQSTMGINHWLVEYDDDCNEPLECKAAAVDLGNPGDSYTPIGLSQINTVNLHVHKYISVRTGSSLSSRTYRVGNGTYLTSINNNVDNLRQISVSEIPDGLNLNVLVSGAGQMVCNFNTVEETGECMLPSEDEYYSVNIDYSIFPMPPELSNDPVNAPLSEIYKGEYTVTLLNYTLNQLGMNSL